jgi:uncharacterized protein YPO0396
MKDDVQSHPSLFENLDGGRDQFHLTRIQTFNWGTFPGVLDMPIPEKGFLLVGPSGSGKSTILDAHTTLLTPPKWLDFNAAAGESGKERFRNIISYVRGAWSNNTGDSGEQVTRYVRTGTTWSVIAETYANGHGVVVVLAQIFFVKGSSNANGDVKKLYLVLDHPFDVKELKFFADSEFDVRKLKHGLADAHIKEEFSAYQTVFRERLGIGSERALRLLHKTQSAKHLGDLPVFLRDFMLDLPETFEVADQLVLEFEELNAAHQAVVAAENQIATLAPARDDHARMEAAQAGLTDVKELEAGLEGYREQRRKALLVEVITQLKLDIEGSKQEERRLQERATEEANTLQDLKDRRLAQGGGTLARLEQDIQSAEQERPVKLAKQAQARAAAAHLGQTLPDNATAFTQLVHTAKQRLIQASEMARELEGRKDALKADIRDRSTEFRAALDEVRAMEEQRSNIPSRMLAVRSALAREIGVAEENLPFAGELIEVKPEASEWQGAIERVLNGFAQSLLVDDRYYASVSAFLNANNIGTRLVYFRVTRHTRQAEAPRPSALIHKLALANTPFKDWLREELKLHFDYECADTLAAFRASSKAITREGQVKHSATRHEKNDNFRIDDRSRWVLGFDNKASSRLDGSCCR